MTAKKKKNEVNRKLTRAVEKMLDEVMATPARGKTGASLTDKCKVIDRFTKLEAMRLLKLQDENEGGFFNRDPDGADDE